MDKKFKIKKYSLKKLETVSTILSEKEQLTIYGGYFYCNGFYYISQSELVDILGSSDAIPSYFESTMVLVYHSEDYSYQSFKHYYKLTPEQFEEIMGKRGSSFYLSSSESSYDSSNCSSDSCGFEQPQTFEVLPSEIESSAYSIAQAIINRIKALGKDSYRNLSSKAKSEMSKDCKESVLSMFYTAYKKDEDKYESYEIITKPDRTHFSCMIFFQKKSEKLDYNVVQIINSYSQKYPKK